MFESIFVRVKWYYNFPSNIIHIKISDQSSRVSHNKAIRNYLDVTLVTSKAGYLEKGFLR